MFEHPPVYFAKRVDCAPLLDSECLDPVWNDAEWTLPFEDILGDKGPLPRHLTRVKMLWGDSGLYIFADMDEPHLWATLTDFNSIIFQDNDFEWFIDPDGDNCNYLEWEVNVFGTQMNLFMRKPYLAGGDYEFVTYDGLRHKIRLSGTVNDSTDIDKGWSVECHIPWSVFQKYGAIEGIPQLGDVWRISFSRVQWDLIVKDELGYDKVKDKPEHNWTWTNQHDINMHRPWFWGYLFFGLDEGWFDADHEARMRLAEVFELKNGGVSGGVEGGNGVVLEEFEGGWRAWTVGSGGKKVFMDQTSRMWTED